MAESTTTDPLTTIFTPPATCVSHWTYEGEFYNSISGGLLIQDVLQAYPDTDCFPTDFSANGRAPAVAQVYSPGACPIGYSTAENFYNGAVTTAVCCLTDFSYTSIFSTIDNGESSAEFQGCISMYQTDAGYTTVLARSDLDDLNTTAVSGPLTMWAQPISVAFRQADLTLFTTATTSPTSTSSSTAVAASTPTGSFASQTASPTALATQTPSDTGLSGGAIAGIVIAAVAVLALIIGLGIFFRRRRSRAQATYTEPAYEPVTLPESEKQRPAELEAQWNGAELDGNWRGHEMPAAHERLKR